jgi:hypothetical protein
MSDRVSGLTRRIQGFVYTRETSEELGHLVEETREDCCDSADALIELALASEAGADVRSYLGDDVDPETPPVGVAVVTIEEDDLDALDSEGDDVLEDDGLAPEEDNEAGAEEDEEDDLGTGSPGYDEESIEDALADLEGDVGDDAAAAADLEEMTILRLGEVAVY